MLWGDQNAVDEMINEDVIKTLCEIENGCCLQRSLDSILIDIFHVLHRQGFTISSNFLYPGHPISFQCFGARSIKCPFMGLEVKMSSNLSFP